ncbi:MAG: hypothetical protein J1F13_05295 [Prevotellaceae bacterium]|nr:hypothetical protein [Prevotellaceae bacterium]
MGKQIIDTLATNDNMAGTVLNNPHTLWSFNVWTIVAIVEFIALIIAVYKTRRSTLTTENRQRKRKAMAEVVDYDNIMNSAFYAPALYKQLKGKCHPDKFAKDPVKSELALEISQLVGKNKNNIKELLALKQRAIDELNVNF